jgi:hypothetical protein
MDTQEMTQTDQQYDQIIAQCKSVFLKKAKDYGTSWRIFRMISIADQIMIKALRIRNLQQVKVNKVGDDIASEFNGIINYGIIALMQMELGEPAIEDLPVEKISPLYDTKAAFTKSVMQDKNHDYGEAWRDMSQESFADLILVKLHRIKQILANDGQTLISEGIDSNMVDIINYAIFGLILISEGVH